MLHIGDNKKEDWNLFSGNFHIRLDTRDCILKQKGIHLYLCFKIKVNKVIYVYSCRTVEILLTDRRATVPPIVKTVYLLCTKSCARFGHNFSIFLLCQVKIPDEKNTRHVNLLGKKYKQTSSSLLLATVGLKFSSRCSR